MRSRSDRLAFEAGGSAAGPFWRWCACGRLLLEPIDVAGGLSFRSRSRSPLFRLVAHVLIRLLVITPLPSEYQVIAALFPVSVLWAVVGREAGLLATGRRKDFTATSPWPRAHRRAGRGEKERMGFLRSPASKGRGSRLGTRGTGLATPARQRRAP